MVLENGRNEGCEKRLLEIAAIREDGFVPPSPLCIENARIFLEGLEGPLEPDIFPTPEGGLIFEWFDGFFDACFETDSDGGSGEFSLVSLDGSVPDVSFEASLSGGGKERIVEILEKAFETYESIYNTEER